ncbi:reverse transcriptase domain-containing protein [Tanacetum coccineum]
MVAYLQKSEGSEEFHQIVYFLTASHIRYALTESPTIYVSLIKQFWQTATASTLENGDMEITATIDGEVKVVSEASIRRHLKLEDSDDISDLPTIEIFEQLALMGVDTPLFQTMLVQGQILQGEGSTIPVESYHTPIVAPSTLQPHHSPTLRDFIRQETEVSQPSSPTQTHVADEAASTGVDVKHGGATTIVYNLDAGQGSGNIDKTPAMPHDSPLPRVHILGSDEGRMQHNESIDLVTKLLDRVVSFETDLQQTKKVYGVAYTKLIKKVKRLEDKLNKSRRKSRLIGAQTQGRHDHEMDADFEFTTTEDVAFDLLRDALSAIFGLSELKEMAPKRATRSTPVTENPTTTTVTNAQLQAMIDQGVTAALAARDANRNGDDSHTSGTGARRTERVTRECTYQDFMKCQPLYFKGTEGVVELTQWFERMETVFRISNCSVENQIKFSTCTLLAGALTWWNSHVRIVGHDVAYAMTWIDLRKKMTDKYCPRNEIKKLETELWNLKVKGTDVTGYNQRFQELALLCVRMFPEESDKVERYVGGLPDMIHKSVVASKPKTMQEATEMATELMDKKISTLVERQAENKRKLDNNNQAQQHSPKRQNVARVYAAGTGERKEYARTLPLCNRCKLHHNGQCTVKCVNCKKVGHITRDCRNPAAARNQRTLTCYECGNQGHYKSDCPKLKNRNHGNQAEGTGTHGMVLALGGGETDQDPNNIEDEIEA